MKFIRLVVSLVMWLFIGCSGYAAISPIQADYGNVFPTLTEQSIDVFRTRDPAPWFVSFNLLADADVKLGVQSLPEFQGNIFDLTSIRLVTLEGSNIDFGTDTFSVNPFPSPIEALVEVNNLSAGNYALEISGSGNRTWSSQTRDLPDFTARIQVLPASVPLPAAVWLFGSALAGLGCLGKRRTV